MLSGHAYSSSGAPTARVQWFRSTTGIRTVDVAESKVTGPATSGTIGPQYGEVNRICRVPVRLPKIDADRGTSADNQVGISDRNARRRVLPRSAWLSTFSKGRKRLQRRGERLARRIGLGCERHTVPFWTGGRRKPPTTCHGSSRPGPAFPLAPRSGQNVTSIRSSRTGIAPNPARPADPMPWVECVGGSPLDGETGGTGCAFSAIARTRNVNSSTGAEESWNSTTRSPLMVRGISVGRPPLSGSSVSKRQIFALASASAPSPIAESGLKSWTRGSGSRGAQRDRGTGGGGGGGGRLRE